MVLEHPQVGDPGARGGIRLLDEVAGHFVSHYVVVRPPLALFGVEGVLVKLHGFVRGDAQPFYRPCDCGGAREDLLEVGAPPKGWGGSQGAWVCRFELFPQLERRANGGSSRWVLHRRAPPRAQGRLACNGVFLTCLTADISVPCHHVGSGILT
mgnify:CR=1 FL=1